VYQYSAKIVSAYDGDTFRADVDLGFHTWIKDAIFRLYGIDTPEMRSPTTAAGVAARDAFREKVLGKPVMIATFKDRTEKYGRYLAVIWLDGENVNQWMIDAGYAVPYLLDQAAPG